MPRRSPPPVSPPRRNSPANRAARPSRRISPTPGPPGMNNKSKLDATTSARITSPSIRIPPRPVAIFSPIAAINTFTPARRSKSTGVTTSISSNPSFNRQSTRLLMVVFLSSVIMFQLITPTPPRVAPGGALRPPLHAPFRLPPQALDRHIRGPPISPHGAPASRRNNPSMLPPGAS